MLVCDDDNGKDVLLALYGSPIPIQSLHAARRPVFKRDAWCWSFYYSSILSSSWNLLISLDYSWLSPLCLLQEQAHVLEKCLDLQWRTVTINLVPLNSWKLAAGELGSVSCKRSLLFSSWITHNSRSGIPFLLLTWYWNWLQRAYNNGWMPFPPVFFFLPSGTCWIYMWVMIYLEHKAFTKGHFCKQTDVMMGFPSIVLGWFYHQEPLAHVNERMR